MFQVGTKAIRSVTLSAFEVKHRNSLENDALNNRDHAHTHKQTNSQDKPNEGKERRTALSALQRGRMEEVMDRKRFTLARYPQALGCSEHCLERLNVYKGLQ